MCTTKGAAHSDSTCECDRGANYASHKGWCATRGRWTRLTRSSFSRTAHMHPQSCFEGEVNLLYRNHFRTGEGSG